MRVRQVRELGRRVCKRYNRLTKRCVGRHLRFRVAEEGVVEAEDIDVRRGDGRAVVHELVQDFGAVAIGEADVAEAGGAVAADVLRLEAADADRRGYGIPMQVV